MRADKSVPRKHEAPDVQAAGELDTHYSVEDPWNYDGTPDDKRRRERLLSLLPRREYRRSLDIGCGNGFLTFSLPGDAVVGCDISEKAIRWAEKRAQARADRDRFDLRAISLFQLPLAKLDRFDLIVMTGVLYRQYIGEAFSLVRMIVDDLLEPNGVMVSVHIDEWCRHHFPYTLLDLSFYSYREYTHRVEVYSKCS